MNCVGSRGSRGEVCSLGWRLWRATRVTSVVDEQHAHGVCVCRETDKGLRMGQKELPQEFLRRNRDCTSSGSNGIRDGEGDKSVRGCRTQVKLSLERPLDLAVR